MTDKEIIKALENCMSSSPCTKCPYQKILCCSVERDALNLINRQNAKIDTLQKQVRVLGGQIERERQTIRTEAIKEFAERLTHTLVINNEENTDYFDFAYTLETIDAIKEEMTGETKTDTDFPKDYSYGY